MLKLHAKRVADIALMAPEKRGNGMVLARVLYNNACLLALDKATAHLDTNCERQTNKALRRPRPTRILITHGPEK